MFRFLITTLTIVIISLLGMLAYFFFVNNADTSNKSFQTHHFLKHLETSKQLDFQEINDLPKFDRPDLALMQDFLMTKDLELGYPPVEKKIKAHSITQELLEQNQSSRNYNEDTWLERGPSNVGGRTRAIMFDPNDATNRKVFVGSVSGGIWYNNDITSSTSQWDNIDDFMTTLSISSLAFDPNDYDYFYAGTGEYFTFDSNGSGIWRSENGGKNWSQLTETAVFEEVTRIVVNNDSRIIAATSNGIKISDDKGNSWFSSTLNSPISDLELANDGTLYCGTFSGDIYKSINDGQSWTRILSSRGYRVELAVFKGDSNVLYGMIVSNDRISISHCIVTKDGGDNWSDLSIPNYYDASNCSADEDDFTKNQAFHNLILKVDNENPDLIYAGGIDLYRSSNGGNEWELMSHWAGNCAVEVHADQHEIMFRPESNTEVIIANDGGVYYAENVQLEEVDFEARNNNYNVTQFYSVALENTKSSNNMIGGTQDNGTQLFADAGINQTELVIGGDGGLCFIDQNEPNLYIGSYVYNNYYVSSDGGLRFKPFGAGDDVGQFINPCDYDDKSNTLYASGDKGTIYRYNIGETDVDYDSISIDIGVSGLVSFILVSPIEDDVIYVGTAETGSIYKVSNVSGVPDSDRILQYTGASISSVDVNSLGDILITVSNYGAISVIRSDDGGSSWRNVEGNLPDMPVWDAMFNPYNPSREVIIATESGVWVSNDVTARDVIWQPSNEGLANVSCRKLEWRQSDGLVAVATHGRGVFTSNNIASNVLSAETDSSDQKLVKAEISVFPNPTEGEMNIESEVPIDQIKIYDLIGNLVYIESIGLSSLIDLANLEAGQYIAILLNNDKIVLSQKVIKK